MEPNNYITSKYNIDVSNIDMLDEEHDTVPDSCISKTWYNTFTKWEKFKYQFCKLRFKILKWKNSQITQREIYDQSN